MTAAAPIEQAHGRREVTDIYRAIVWQLRRQVIEIGATMAQVDDFVGIADGYFAKMLHADSASGRQSSWPILDMIVQGLFPLGYRLKIIPLGTTAEIRDAINRKLEHHGTMLSGLSRVEREAARGQLGRMQLRDLSRFAGRKGGESRARRLSPMQRSRIAKRAALMRWRRVRENAAGAAMVGGSPCP